MNCALKLVNEISLYYDARSEKHQYIYIYIPFAEYVCETWFLS